jgi:DNA repair exonuclease SbcCD nuclease subunit
MNKKVLFIGDIHLNEWSLFARPVQFNGRIINSRLLEQLNVLEQILFIVSCNKYERVILLGDIFHRFTTQTFFIFNFFLKHLRELCENIILVAGNHDYIDETKRLTYFDYFDYKIKVIKDLEVIDGIGYLAFVRDEEIGNYRLKKLLDEGVNILIMHNNVEDMVLPQGIRTKGLSKALLKRFNYVFNGHYHVFNQYRTFTGYYFNIGAIMDTSFVDANTGIKGVFEFDFNSFQWKRYELKYKPFLILTKEEFESLSEDVKVNSYIKLKVEVDELKDIKESEQLEVVVKPKKKEIKVLTLEEVLKQIADNYKNRDLAEKFIFSLL